MRSQGEMGESMRSTRDCVFVRMARVALVALLPLFGGWSSCERSLNADPSFDAWCGDRLCAWRTDDGQAKQVPTWHEADHGVELAGDPAQISQLITPASPGAAATCVRFEAMTDLASDASVTLGFDFADDGSVDYTTALPATHWESVKVLLALPEGYPTMRILLRKTGAGRAVLAHLRFVATAGCTSDPVPWTQRPNAAPCEAHDQCGSGRCAGAVFPYQVPGITSSCATCRDDADCMAAEACGVRTGPFGMYAGCRPRKDGLLGDRCVSDSNCAAGVCCGGVCSGCCKDSCGGQVACEQVAAKEGPLWVVRPWLCAPGKKMGAAGAPCVADADCASGACRGAGPLAVCWYDGRSCKVDADCPGGFSAFGIDSSCIPLGVADGHCQ